MFLPFKITWDTQKMDLSWVSTWVLATVIDLQREEAKMTDPTWPLWIEPEGG